jgi:hypothetical protein
LLALIADSPTVCSEQNRAVLLARSERSFVLNPSWLNSATTDSIMGYLTKWERVY